MKTFDEGETPWTQQKHLLEFDYITRELKRIGAKLAIITLDT